MKSTINYKVMGRADKASKRIDALKAYIADNFNVKGKRLGVANFIKQFGKFDDEKSTLQSASIPSVKEIQIACRLLSTELKDGGGAIPCVVCKNGVTTIETHDANDFELFYQSIKHTERKTDATKFIITYMTKHESEIDFNAIQTALDGMKD